PLAKGELFRTHFFGYSFGIVEPQHRVDVRQIGALLSGLLFQLGDLAGQVAALAAQCGNDMWVDHPHMVRWRLADLNAVVVALAREYREFLGRNRALLRLDRLARSTRDLLNTLAAITGKKAGFR